MGYEVKQAGAGSHMRTPADIDPNGRISLYDGALVLFRRPKSPFYYADVKIAGERKRKSTGTADLKSAFEVGETFYRDSRWRVDRGFTLASKTISQVGAEMVAFLEQEVAAGRMVPTKLADYRREIENTIGPCLGERLITDLSDRDVVEYRNWLGNRHTKLSQKITYERSGRKVTSIRPRTHTHPMKTETINRKITFLRGLMNFARENGYVSAGQLPHFKTVAVKDQARRALMFEEYRTLVRTARQQQDEAAREVGRYQIVDGRRTLVLDQERQQNERKVKDFRRAAVIYRFVQFMVQTGLRPQEAKNLTWGAITPHQFKDGVEGVRMRVRGKDKSRDVYGRTKIKRLLDVVRTARRPQNDDELVWPVGSFKKQLKRLFRDAGLEQPSEGPDYCAYSLRHTFITFQLLYHQVPIDRVAIKTGTSVAMIERFYSKLSTLLIAEQDSRDDDW